MRVRVVENKQINRKSSRILGVIQLKYNFL